MSKVEAVVKLEARTQLAACRQGAYESIVAFRQRYNNALKLYHDQKNPRMSDEDIAMDFFSKLDNGRYAEFKTTYLNYLQMKGCNPPKDHNEMYTLASMHLKPKKALGSRIGSTFGTMVDQIVMKAGEEKGRQKRGGKNNSGGQQMQDGNHSDKTNNGEGEQPSKEKVKCFYCGKDHYINNFPEFLQFKKSKEDKKQAAAMWDVSMFVTYQVNAIGIDGFKMMEVLLDNQANISIMRPKCEHTAHSTLESI